MTGSAPIPVGVVGARGYVGAETVRLLCQHPGFELCFVSSRARAGRPVADEIEGFTGDLRFEDLDPTQIAARGAGALILALPNGHAAAIVDALDRAGADPVVVDLSADFRFDDGWRYGLPERRREALRGCRRIANPGCYATAFQLAVAPLLDQLAGPPHGFGVSGYSGAGTTPSERNDVERLTGGILPYSLTGHIHEAEVGRQLGRPVCFIPHVAPFFRGITLTASMELRAPLTGEQLVARYRDAYAGEPLVAVTDSIPRIQDHVGRHHATVGGFAVSADGRHAVVVAALDNLLKGAATQAVQNLNLACGLDELEGIRKWLD